jgi:hypothetical protein
MIKTTKKLKNTVKTEAAKTPATTTMASAKPVAAKPITPEPVAVKPAPSPAPIVTAPKPVVKNLVSLELVKPEAKSVSVAGSFNEWKPEKTPLVSLGNGRWKGDLNVKPGRHEYLFVVDGQWVPDPNAKESVANPFGGTNSVLIVSE